MKFLTFVQYLKSKPWWEKKITNMEAWENGWIDDYTGCMFPEYYGGWRHKMAHIIVAWLSAFGVRDGKIVGGEYDGQLFSPAATFHMWHRRLGGHGQGAY